MPQHDDDLDRLRGERRLHRMDDQGRAFGLGQKLVWAAHPRRAAGSQNQNGHPWRLLRAGFLGLRLVARLRAAGNFRQEPA